LQCALEDGAVREKAGVRTHCSGDGVALGEQSMPAPFQGHALSHVQGKHRKCMVRGDRTKWFCGCGRAICGTPGNKICYPWHLNDIMSRNLEEGAVQWPRGKKAWL
jgi:hypothetical protein